MQDRLRFGNHVGLALVALLVHIYEVLGVLNQVVLLGGFGALFQNAVFQVSLVSLDSFFYQAVLL